MTPQTAAGRNLVNLTEAEEFQRGVIEISREFLLAEVLRIEEEARALVLSSRRYRNYGGQMAEDPQGQWARVGGPVRPDTL